MHCLRGGPDRASRQKWPSGFVREAFLLWEVPFMEDKVTVPEIGKMKQTGEKITALTAYDYSLARVLD